MEQDTNQSNTSRLLPFLEGQVSLLEGSSVPSGRAQAERERTGGESFPSLGASGVSAPLSLIAAVAANGAIGFENKLLYWLPNDLKRFKALTTGHTIVMGRRTFESLPKGALPNRRNVVLSRNADFIAAGAEVYPSLEAALATCGADEEVYVIGGASIYAQALPFARRLCLTLVHDTPAAADAFFPWLNPSDWRVENEERHSTDERHAFNYTFIDYVRA